MMTPWAPRTLAVLRIVTALLFLEHATMKFFAFPAKIPNVPQPLPTIMLVAGVIEVMTGFLVTAGLYTRVAAFVASGEMATAYWMAHASQGPWPTLNMGEPAVLFCFVFLHIAAAGAGAWSLDTWRQQRAPT